MSLLPVALAYAVGLVIVFSIALSIVKHLRNRRDIKHDGFKVVATVFINQRNSRRNNFPKELRGSCSAK